MPLARAKGPAGEEERPAADNHGDQLATRLEMRLGLPLAPL